MTNSINPLWDVELNLHLEDGAVISKFPYYLDGPRAVANFGEDRYNIIDGAWTQDINTFIDKRELPKNLSMIEKVNYAIKDGDLKVLCVGQYFINTFKWKLAKQIEILHSTLKFK